MSTSPEAEAIDSPNYRVVESADHIEIREYEQALIAQVTVSGDRKEASNRAFRLLFDFISGANQSQNKIAMTAPVIQQPPSQKIAMTAPVSQQATDDGQWDIAFFMPAEYTIDTVPVPTNNRVRLIELSEDRIIAIRFSGRNSDSNFDKHHQELLAYIQTNNIEHDPHPIYAYYNSPFTPWFMRRNEIMYRLK